MKQVPAVTIFYDEMTIPKLNAGHFISQRPFST